MYPLRYYMAQILQAHSKRWKPPREHFIDLVIGAVALPPTAEVLCVGARNGQEPEAWWTRGYSRAIGVDLLPSLHPGMRWGDFHCLWFLDSVFDVVYGSHAWEHAWDPDAALREATRVLKPGGVLFAAFPLGFTPSAHDRVDFGSVPGFVGRFRGCRLTTVWSVETPTEGAVLVRLDAK